jgi:hypothetical protein
MEEEGVCVMEKRASTSFVRRCSVGGDGGASSEVGLSDGIAGVEKAAAAGGLDHRRSKAPSGIAAADMRE